MERESSWFEKLENFLLDIVEKAKENPKTTLAVLAFLAFFLIFPTVLLVLIIITIIFGAGLLAVKLVYGEPSLKELFRKKRQINAELKLLEANYLKRKISPETYNKIFREKQSQLIKLEAQISESYNTSLGKAGGKELKEVTAKKRHVLNNLLAEKRKTLNEMKIAERKYLKRAIDNSTYKRIVQENQQKLIELEVKIKDLYSQQNIENTLKEMKSKLAEADAREAAEERAKRRAEIEEIRRTVQELAEQMQE